MFHFQDDILTGTLTVRENIYLSAMLRLPPEMTKDEKLEKVDEVIEELGISHVANTLVCVTVSCSHNKLIHWFIDWYTIHSRCIWRTKKTYKHC